MAPIRLTKDVKVYRDVSTLVQLRRGEILPAELEHLVTNPALLEHYEDSTLGESDSHQGGDEDTPEPIDYRRLKKDDIVALATERGVDASGTIPQIAERLKEQDAAKAAEADAAAAAGAETSETPAGAPEIEDEADLFNLTETELRALAQARGVDVGEATTEVELATLIAQAAE